MYEKTRKPIALVLSGAATLSLASCEFGNLWPVADLEQRRVIALLSANNDADGERDRIYVGQHLLGTEWNPVETKVVAIEASSGAQTGETNLWPELADLRSVAADPNEEYAWTLHDDGSIVVWPKDLGNAYAMAPTFFESPYGMSTEHFCDLELLPDGQYLATGVASDGERTYGFIHHKAPHPSYPGGYYPGWTHWETTVLPGEEHELSRYCPRIAYDDSTQEVVMLLRSATRASGYDIVERLEGYVFAGNYWGLQHVDEFLLAPRRKMRPVDITAGQEHTFLLREYFDNHGTPGGQVEVHHTDTGALEDTATLEEMRAVHWADFVVDINQPMPLWWAGWDPDSDMELGMLEAINDE